MKGWAKHIVLFVFAVFGLFGTRLEAQEEDVKTNILFLLDASQSMKEGWDGSPMFEVARQIIVSTVDSLANKENFNMALRVYGHQSHYSINNCKDSKLEVGFGPYSHILIPSRLNEIQPKGITPLSYALSQSAGDFPTGGNARNVIIIMTDGKESCEGDPCEVSTLLQKKGIVLKPFVIGLGYSTEKYTNLDCVGIYYEAATPEEAKRSMNDIMSKVSENTTVQINLLDENKNATETDVNMSFLTGDMVRSNIYHTLNNHGLPDTIDIDPINTYTIKVHTIPSVKKTGLLFEANRHNEVDISVPQGKLRVSMPFSNTRYDRRIQVLISKPNEPYTLNVQEINSIDEYLTGNYDLTILTLPKIKLDKVNIRQDHTTEIEIPEPGLISIEHDLEIVGGIFQYVEDELVKIAALNDQLLKQTILLQPGKYYLIYRKKIALQSEKTRVKVFTVSSGESVKLNLE